MYLTLNEPKKENYKNLLRMAFKVCDKFVFIRHSQLSYSKSVDILIDALNEAFIECKEQNEWPGTLSVPKATVYYFNTTEKVKEIIINSCDSLFMWCSPNLPDDLSFLQKEKEWLITTSHESLCGINTDDESEIEEIKNFKGLIKSIKNF